MSNPSASKLPLGFICEPSIAMAQAGHADTKDSFRGHGAHGFVVRAIAIGAEEALAEVPEDAPHRGACEDLDLSRVPKGARVEVALRWNGKTDQAQILGDNVTHDMFKLFPRRSDEEWDGITDLFALCEDGDGKFIWIGDWKFGFRSTGRTEENQQLRALALYAARAFGVDRARITTLVRQEGRNERDYSADLDALDLVAIAEGLRGLGARRRANVARLAREPHARLPVVEGPHCLTHYCSAYSGCWAKQELVRAAFSTGPISTIDIVEMAPEEVGRAYARARELVHVLEERVIPSIKGLAAQLPGGVPLPDGQVLAEVEVADKPRIRAEAVEAALGRVLVPTDLEKVLPVAVTAKPTANLTSIEKGLRLVAPRGQLARLVANARDALRAEGGIVEGKHLEVRAVSPKRLGA